MDKLVVAEGPPLTGSVPVSGAKNAVLPILAATLLTDEPCVIEGAPNLRDVNTMIRMMERLGVQVERCDDGSLETRLLSDDESEAPYELVKTMRASVTVLGPLLAKRGRARVSFPGGCVFGPRPVDLHIKGLRALGAEIDVSEGYILARAGRLEGTTMFLGGPFGSTVTGTANVLMAAVLAEGRTVIAGAACEPEMADLARFLVSMGARIEGIGSPQLVVDGVDRLGGARHRVIPDRIEAGTFLAAGAITGGDVTVTGIGAEHLRAVIDKLREIGLKVTEGEDRIRVAREGPLGNAEVVTLPYPGFPTDLQAQFMALLSIAEGVSVITEKIYPDRFMHVAELMRMRARIRKEGPNAIVIGTPWLSGAPVMASDLRASAALVLAGLVAKGTTDVKRVYHIDRGYERIEEKLRTLGADIRREEDPEAP
ncbi:MAG: UDP-N-acetylglucosamine 1-carboxyvinyltransferase [Planctomycetota bacterium]|jgi:UDP-N-acetylglucosamine 1-carboxyvinyltransferase